MGRSAYRVATHHLTNTTKRECTLKLGELIGVAREVKGLTLREMEKISGVSNAYLSQIETGKIKDPGFSTIVRIATALNLSLDRLAATVRPFTDTSVLRSR
jgi:HTH-type transcriptional regulator, competence development regulator